MGIIVGECLPIHYVAWWLSKQLTAKFITIIPFPYHSDRHELNLECEIASLPFNKMNDRSEHCSSKQL